MSFRQVQYIFMIAAPVTIELFCNSLNGEQGQDASDVVSPSNENATDCIAMRVKSGNRQHILLAPSCSGSSG